jgi:hypothetical protein
MQCLSRSKYDMSLLDHATWLLFRKKKQPIIKSNKSKITEFHPVFILGGNSVIFIIVQS